MNQEVTDYINAAPEDKKEILEIIRSIVHESVANVIEEFKWSRPIFKLKKDFAYLQVNKNHVNLGFYQNFEKLNDPEGILEGTGKTMRHIKIRKVSDIRREQLKEWFSVMTQ